jgi:hypothetical protein
LASPPTKALGKSLRILRLREAERHVVAVIAAQGIRERRRWPGADTFGTEPAGVREDDRAALGAGFIE